MDRLVNWLVGRLGLGFVVVGLVDWLVGRLGVGGWSCWLVGWLVGQLVGWQARFLLCVSLVLFWFGWERVWL